MRISVAKAMEHLEGRGLLSCFRRPWPEQIIPYVEGLIGRPLPQDLVDLYREGIAEIVEYAAIVPVWNDRVGWRTPESLVTELLHVDAIPLFYDGCGSKFALDLTPGVETPAVYFFDHDDRSGFPSWAAGSSLGAFLLLAADHDRAIEEGWPEKWELAIDPDIDKCPRARAIWAAG